MATTFQCPACGGIIEYTSNNQDMNCPFCGTAITTPGAGAAATVIMAKVEKDPAASAKTVVQHSKFGNTAEIMDEVKRLLREGDKEGAVKVYSKEFSVPMIDAQASIDQIEIDMKHSGKEAAPAPQPEPEPVPVSTPAPSVSAQQIPNSDILDAAPPTKKSGIPKGWLIGCGVAFLIACCICLLVSVAFTVLPKLTGNS